jgi:thioredoxin reductase (NADPH)
VETIMAVRDLIIIGSGPGGLTAGIYSGRANLAPLLIQGLQSGGQLMTTTEVENFPGFAEGIMGPKLMMEMKEQAARFGAELVQANVSRVDFSKRPFEVEAEGETHLGRTVIISTGAKARMLGIPGETELIGHGVSTCATCDGAFFRDREIGIVGGGDSALEEALFLTRFGKRVRLFHRRDELRASQIMRERALAHDKIEMCWNTVLTEVLDEGSGLVTKVRTRNTQTDEEGVVDLDGLFIAIGHVPNTELFREQVECDADGYILTHDGTKTSVDGVFACGDVQDRIYRQAITAAGTGCMAAIDCERWLEAHED